MPGTAQLFGCSERARRSDAATTVDEEQFPRRFPRIGAAFQARDIPNVFVDEYSSNRPVPIFIDANAAPWTMEGKCLGFVVWFEVSWTTGIS
jgi:hypothetical protein